MPSNYLILCCPLLLLPSVFPSIRVFSSESVLRIRWPKYWSFSFNISPFSEYLGLTCFRIDWFDPLQSKGLSRVFSNTTVQKYQDTSHSHSKRVKVERKRPVYSVSYTLQTTLGFKPTNNLVTLLHFLASGLRPSIFIFSFQGKAAPFYQPVSCLYDGDLTAFFHFVLFSSPIFQ